LLLGNEVWVLRDEQVAVCLSEQCGYALNFAGSAEGYRKPVGERTKDTGEAFPEWTKFLFLFFAHAYIFPMNIPDQGI
jgi:hypothetical protein